MSASERRDSARTAVVWAALGPILHKQSLEQPGLDVLDIGGGTGGFVSGYRESCRSMVVTSKS